MMAAQKEDYAIDRTVRCLDLRNVRTSMQDSKRNVLASASARKASPKHPLSHAQVLGSPASTSSRKDQSPARPRTAGASPTTVRQVDLHSPSQTASALAYFHKLESERDFLQQKVEAMEEAMHNLTQLFEKHIAAVEATVGPTSQFYTVTFPPGAVGMLVTEDAEASQIRVAELRDDPETGEPLLAKASGKIFVGDLVLAVNGNFLSRHGVPTAEQVALEFRSAARPMTVLFQRDAAHRLASTAEHHE